MTKEITARVGSIQKFSTEDGPGVRSTVFLKGCPLNCAWCHNPEMISTSQQMIISPKKCIKCSECIAVCTNGSIEITGNGPVIDWNTCVTCGECAKACYANAIKPVAEEMSVEEVFERVLQDKDFYVNTRGGVTISGGEALIHPEFVEALIDMCAKENIKVCIDTSGYSDYSLLEEIAMKVNVEYLLYDMKHIVNEEHIKYTGVGNSIIINNLRKLAANPQLKSKIWMRMPLIAEINDTEELIEKTAALYAELGIEKVSLMSYHDFGNSKGEHVGRTMDNFKAPSDERMNEIKKRFESIGMVVEITGQKETIER